MRRRDIQAELEAHRILAEIATKELEIGKNLIQKEWELNRLEKLDGIQEGVESVVLKDQSTTKENISEDTFGRRAVKYDEMKQWNGKKNNENGCDKFHQHLLHMETPMLGNIEQIQNSETVSHHFEEVREKEVLLRVARGPKRDHSTYALVDEALTVTLLSDDRAPTIRLQGTTDPLKIRWTYSGTDEEKDSTRSMNLQTNPIDLMICDNQTPWRTHIGRRQKGTGYDKKPKKMENWVTLERG
ncbi:hypothetical protein JTB14_010135 [Gonioctena quinquepunctata]|nr:hypothetical protein JTB14_010135 [Gonioctena quinquepunctata]